MDYQQQLKNFALVKSIDSFLKVLLKLSDDRLFSLPFVKRGLDSIAHLEGREFLKRLIVLGKRALTERSENCGRKFVMNLLVNEIALSGSKRKAFAQREGFLPPYLMVISPTMRCNLRCYGCYAGSYQRGDDLDFNTVSRVIEEGKGMGIYFITISGGEPFIYEHLLDLFAEHLDVYFQVYTNGTLIDGSLAKELSRLGNALPVISVEGFQEETELRRGHGTLKLIIEAMHILREKGIIFGFSATATRQNNELIVRDEFIDFYVDQGCLLGWYFNYVPVGRKPDMDLMPTPEQRNYRRMRLNQLRKAKPVLLADFWNDGPLVGGCIAGGRYLHINNRGDVEPCVFTHFAVDNVNEKSLTEILKSDFFQSIRAKQPYGRNHLRPCMIIDHPHILREVVAEANAHPTHQKAEAIISQLAGQLDEYSEAYARIVDEVWKTDYQAGSPTVSLKEG